MHAPAGRDLAALYSGSVRQHNSKRMPFKDAICRGPRSRIALPLPYFRTSIMCNVYRFSGGIREEKLLAAHQEHNRVRFNLKTFRLNSSINRILPLRICNPPLSLLFPLFLRSNRWKSNSQRYDGHVLQTWNFNLTYVAVKTVKGNR